MNDKPTGYAQPKIDVRIAYEPGGRIGDDYNRIMSEAAHEWVLFLDHDVLLLHPSWYEVCQRAITDNPRGGLFTMWTNNIGCKLQLAPDAPAGHDITAHRAYARTLWDRHGYACTANSTHLIGGFAMLTSKTAWRSAGGFPPGAFFGVDNEYHRRIMRAGYACYRMDGLYAYHIRDRKGGNWIDGVNTSSTLARQRTGREIALSTGKARNVVYTVVTGGYDRPQPLPVLDGWDAVIFTDSTNVSYRGWRVVRLDAQGLDAARASRLPKILPHKYLPEYEYSLYIDANMHLYRSPYNVAERLRWRPCVSVAHPHRHCVYDELKAIVQCQKAPSDRAHAESARMLSEGVPKGLTLYEGGMLFRKHGDPAVLALDEAWWAEYVKSETGRDQPALAVAAWKTQAAIDTISATERSRFIRLHHHARATP